MTGHNRLTEFYLPHSLYDRLRLSLLEDFEILGAPITSVAVRSDSDAELKRYVTAAAKAYYLGLRSIDRVLKEYGEDWSFERSLTEEQKLCGDILGHVRREVSKTVEWMYRLERKPARLGLFIASAALMRLQASFTASSFLIKRGYTFEALGICRLVLEQMAWAFSIHELKDETLFRVAPSGSIANLKNLLPEVGRFYGMLSKQAHIAPSLVRKYVTLKADLQEVTLATSTDSAQRALNLLSLADYFNTVSEYVYRELLSTFSCLERDQAGNFCAKESRPLSKAIEEYGNAIAVRESQEQGETAPNHAH